MVKIMLVYTPICFVGRQAQTALIQRMLESPTEGEWFLHFVGDGGIGKTQLLHQVIKLAQEYGRQSGHTLLVTQELIDFYLTAHQRESGLLKSIADQLGGSAVFASFYEALTTYHDSPDEFITLRQHFKEGYQALKADYIILLFDTTEVISSAAKRFLSEVIPILKASQTNTFVIAAGRQSWLAIDQDHSHSEIALPFKVKEVTLSGFQAEEVQLFFEQQQISVDFEVIKRLAKLSEGKPILLSLVIDWMKFFGEPLEDLVNYPPNKFVQTMIERIKYLRFPEDQVILAMAHFHRRFNEPLLAYLFDKSTVAAQSLLTNLAQFSFVKYRPAVENNKPSSCLLHDEMRELVNKYVWFSLDPLGTLRSEWELKIIEYYTEQINRENDTLEQENLERECLYYELRLNLAKGFDKWRKLFRQGKNWQVKEAINLEIEPFKDKLSPAQQHEVEFRRGLVLYDREEYEQAIELFEQIQNNKDCPSELWIKILPNLVLAYVNAQGASKAIDLANTKATELQKQIDTDVPVKVIQKNNARLNYAIGYAHRKKNELDKAKDQYETALKQLNSEKSSQKLKADIQKNLGYVLHLLGKDIIALAYCKSALEIHNKAKNYYEIGLTFNVLGIIETDRLRAIQAIDYFESALQAFEEAKSKRGKALVYIAYGRLLRQMTWLKMKPSRESSADKEIQKNYSSAMKMFNEAIDILENSDRSNLAEAWNEKGTLLREKGEYQEAISCFRESLNIAEEFKDTHYIADNWQDLGIVYVLCEDFEQAESCAKKALQRVDGFTFTYDVQGNYTDDHIKGRAQRIIAECYFAKKDYQPAFEKVVESTINLLRATTHNITEKQRHFYSNWEKWISDKIKALPPKEKTKYTKKVITQLDEKGLNKELHEALAIALESAAAAEF
jgi:tetratricopeptide (TPR) repeat protein